MNRRIFRQLAAWTQDLQRPLRHLLLSLLLGSAAVLTCQQAKQHVADALATETRQQQHLAAKLAEQRTRLARLKEAGPLIARFIETPTIDRTPSALAEHLQSAWPGANAPRQAMEQLDARTQLLDLPDGWRQQHLALTLQPWHAEQLLHFADGLASLAGGFGRLNHCDIRRPDGPGTPLHARCHIAWLSFEVEPAP
ncbi:MAG: hypothetical protein PHT48_06180 [Dechloromonas sp.]|nr:hypothetical protein [Dechloromonas sp.]